MQGVPEPVTLEGDGEEFRVSRRADEPGVYDLAWVSGPNDGYGFTVAASDRSTSEPPDFESHIRGFLAQVNPDTGDRKSVV
jgi:hypothetical protein